AFGDKVVLLRVRPDPVRMRLADRRLWHEGLVMDMGQLVVRSAGSVGADGSLAMTAEVAFRGDIAGSTPVLGQLMRTPLVIPLGQGVNAKSTGQVSFNGNLNGASTDLLGSGVVESATATVSATGAAAFAVAATDSLTFTYNGKTFTTAALPALTAGGDLTAKISLANAGTVAGDAALVFKGSKALVFGSSPSSNLDLGAVLKGRSSTGLETMTTSFVAYDTLGMSHEVTVKFEKQVAAPTGTPAIPNNTWKWSVANLDSGTNIVTTGTTGTQATGWLTFDNSGKFQSANTATAAAGLLNPAETTNLTGARVTLAFANGQAQGQQVVLDFSRMSQLQDGNT
ncbi:MAG: hypothetical protein EBS89_14985, partial [Proteobacteria bacterium]|nr:hypothetical protein [Pseudomonadota bacterium]